MLQTIKQNVLLFNIVSTIVILYLLRNYSIKNNILNKIYEIKNWLFNAPFTFFRKYKKIKLPIIDKHVTINLSDEELEEKFNQTCNAVKIYKNKLKFEDWIYLYGLYKQATLGNIKLDNEENGEWVNDHNSEAVNNDHNSETDELKKNNLKNYLKKDIKSNLKSDVENEKINSWANCYNIDKKICKFLYVNYFNQLFPNAIKNLNNTLSINLSKSVSKMKPLEEIKGDGNSTSEINNKLCDILCDNVVFGNLEYVKKTLDSNPYLINEKNSNGLTALHYACDRGYLEIAKHLINLGADPNIEDEYGDCALHIAAYSDKTEIINYLISVGADVNKKNSEGLTVNYILNK